MSGAIAFSANPVTQIIEDKLREQLKAVKRTSMGSEYVAFHASRDEVIALAESDLVNAVPAGDPGPGPGPGHVDDAER